ncbi:MAG: Uma2 family endonuclease [Prevotellaceae bacterium]|jgi:Uma2 family endonuclease|nr:Uma2 family endonuclease [Prevotellaceae bacterium]
MELVLDMKRRYTYADYLTWLDGKTRELLDGIIRKMSPAPRLRHARLSRSITKKLLSYIDKHKGNCEVFYAPFDVRLPKNGTDRDDDQIYTVVQPDICVICDLSKLDERGCLGAPDMVVEITSPSSLKYDFNDKFQIYEAAGVKEYWVVQPEGKNINVYLLQENGKFDEGTVYEDKAQVPVQTLQGLVFDLEELFND